MLFDAIAALSIADIFRTNCAKIGLLTITLPTQMYKRLAALVTIDPEAEARIDLPAQTVTTPLGQWPFPTDPFTKHLLLNRMTSSLQISIRRGVIALAEQLLRSYSAVMPVITVRNVPEHVRDELAARAARSGRSLQEFLLVQLTELASRPSAEDVIARARARASATGSRLSPDSILAARDADRR